MASKFIATTDLEFLVIPPTVTIASITIATPPDLNSSISTKPIYKGPLSLVFAGITDSVSTAVCPSFAGVITPTSTNNTANGLPVVRQDDDTGSLVAPGIVSPSIPTPINFSVKIVFAGQVNVSAE